MFAIFAEVRMEKVIDLKIFKFYIVSARIFFKSLVHGFVLCNAKYEQEYRVVHRDLFWFKQVFEMIKNGIVPKKLMWFSILPFLSKKAW